MSVLVIADSLTYHGPERAELLTDPRIWPNLLAKRLGTPVDVVARQGWTAREAWWALTRDPRVYSLLLPRAEAVVLAVGGMDQLPAALPSYLREGIAYLRPDAVRNVARSAFRAVHPVVVRLTGGPLRMLPQRATDSYLTQCVTALRTIRPGLPVVGIVPSPWCAAFYPSVRAHRPAVAAARAWGVRVEVPMVDLDAAIAPFVPDGLNPDGMHWGWAAHAAVATETAATLGPLLETPETPRVAALGP